MTTTRAGLLPAPRGMADGDKMMAERIAYRLIPAHCSLRGYPRNW
jgi:hypothetical protein